VEWRLLGACQLYPTGARGSGGGGRCAWTAGHVGGAASRPHRVVAGQAGFFWSRGGV